MTESADSPMPDNSGSGRNARDECGSMSELLRVAVPLMLSAGSQSLMNAVDRIILAGCSEEALAAVTPASMLQWTVVCIPMGTILYANTFISQFDGAGQKRQMMVSLWQAIWLALICGILLLVCLPVSRPMLALSGHAPAIVELEAVYFNTLCAGSPVFLLATALSCFFNGRRRTTVVMGISFSAVIVNFVVDYLLVYGIGPFPELGIRGAALATILARSCEVVVYVVLILREARHESLPLMSSRCLDLTLLRKLLRYGVPSGLHYFLDNSGFTLFLLIVGNLSSQDLAATNLAFSVNGLIFVPLLGFGTAIQTLVGHHIGAGKVVSAQQTTRNAVVMGLVWTVSTGLLLVLFPEFCLRPFFLFADPESGTGANVAKLARTASLLLQFVAVYSVFDALSVVFSSALRGAGDTVYPMVITLLASWLVMVLPAILIIQSETPSISKLWLTSTTNIVLTGVLMWRRYASGRWKQIHLITNSGDEDAKQVGHPLQDSFEPIQAAK
jgi:MATE family multidrug resistance protein